MQTAKRHGYAWIRRAFTVRLYDKHNNLISLLIYYLESSSERSSHSHKQKRRWSTESADSHKHSKSTKARRLYSAYEAEASSTTVDTKPHKSNDPCEWSIEEVVQHICEMDPALAPHTELFRKQVFFQRKLDVVLFGVVFDRIYICAF